MLLKSYNGKYITLYVLNMLPGSLDDPDYCVLREGETKREDDF